MHELHDTMVQVVLVNFADFINTREPRCKMFNVSNRVTDNYYNPRTGRRSDLTNFQAVIFCGYGESLVRQCLAFDHLQTVC